jgi:hypothetical protein
MTMRVRPRWIGLAIASMWPRVAALRKFVFDSTVIVPAAPGGEVAECADASRGVGCGHDDASVEHTAAGAQVGVPVEADLHFVRVVTDRAQPERPCERYEVEYIVLDGHWRTA